MLEDRDTIVSFPVVSIRKLQMICVAMLVVVVVGEANVQL